MRHARYLALHVGPSAPFYARIFTLGNDGSEIEPTIEVEIASLDDVEEFLKALAPDRDAEDVQWDDDGGVHVAAGPRKTSLRLVRKAMAELDGPGQTDLMLEPIERAELEAKISLWRRTTRRL